jgi:hypothetical protein
MKNQTFDAISEVAVAPQAVTLYTLPPEYRRYSYAEHEK